MDDAEKTRELWCYTIDGERFVLVEGTREDAIEEAVDALIYDVAPEDVHDVDVSPARQISASQVVPSFARVEEEMQENLVDNFAGDHCGDEVQVRRRGDREEAKREYETFLRAWADKHFLVEWYESVGPGEDVTEEVRRRVVARLAKENEGEAAASQEGGA